MLKCLSCHTKQGQLDSSFCQCGGPLVFLDQKPFALSDRDETRWDIYRYRAAMHLAEDLPFPSVTLGEGLTAMISDQQLENVLYKLDFMMPTASFKDRGASLLVSYAAAIGAHKIIQDSSGNAAAAVAAYAARAAIDCEIYVPKDTSAAKIKQVKAYGAKLNIVDGDRHATAVAAKQHARQADVFYASHVYNPLFHQGTMTYLLEIFEQLGGTLPDVLVVPVGNGTLLLGIYNGLLALKNSSSISRFPRIIAVQSAHCAPIYHKFHKTKQQATCQPTKAEGIAIAEPMRLSQIIDAITATKGTIYTVSEPQITYYHNYLAKQGLYVEATTAATVAAYFENRAEIGRDKQVVIPLCGSGLKK